MIAVAVKNDKKEKNHPLITESEEANRERRPDGERTGGRCKCRLQDAGDRGKNSKRNRKKKRRKKS